MRIAFTSNIKVQLKEFNKAANKTMDELVDIFLNDFGDYILSEAQRNLREEPETKAFDTGALTRSGERIVREKTVVIGFGGPESKDYVLAVEFGSDPGHRPPIAPLIAWCRRVGIPKPEKVAWAIAKKIEQTGLRSRPFLRNAVESAIKEAPRIWKQVLKDYS